MHITVFSLLNINVKYPTTHKQTNGKLEKYQTDKTRIYQRNDSFSFQYSRTCNTNSRPVSQNGKVEDKILDFRISRKIYVRNHDFFISFISVLSFRGLLELYCVWGCNSITTIA